MSSSGRGQSVLKSADDIKGAWKNSQEGARGGAGRVIVEGFIDFDYEITLLTLRHVGGTSFLDPVGHRQVDGDYHESWQPQPMSPVALQRAQDMARKVTDNVGGRGIFGVELFVKKDEVWFSEVSPRPHDTGMVTMISQNLSEFACHARAILGLPVPSIKQLGPSASAVILGHGTSEAPAFSGVLQPWRNQIQRSACLESPPSTAKGGSELLLRWARRLRKRGSAQDRQPVRLHAFWSESLFPIKFFKVKIIIIYTNKIRWRHIPPSNPRTCSYHDRSRSSGLFRALR